LNAQKEDIDSIVKFCKLDHPKYQQMWSKYKVGLKS